MGSSVVIPVLVVCIIIAGAGGVFAGYKLAPAAASAELADGSVTTPKLADSAVTSAKIADGTITSADIANDAVTSGKIADNSVTLQKLASSIVDMITGVENIADNSITSAKIQDGAITDADITAGGISRIANGVVTLAKMAADALARMPALPIATENIADGAVTEDKIADNAITSSKIAENAVTWDMVAGKPLEVVAAGAVDSAGNIYENFNIESVTWDAVNSRWVVSIIGVEYYFVDYVTVATGIGSTARIVTTDSAGDDLLVYVFDTAGNKVKYAFHFVVYNTDAD